MRSILFLLFAVCAMVSCHRDRPQCTEFWHTSGIDSVAFRQQHHFWKNFNFVATDSIPLEASLPGEVASIFVPDSAILETDDQVVVTDIAIVPADVEDSVWVMVARDQMTMGWVHEQTLIERAVPDNGVSRFIQHFCDSRILLFLSCLCLAFILFIVQRFRREHFLIVHFNDIRSFYPTLLCLCMSGLAAFYGSIQNFQPEVWKEFFFYPTLNPFGQPRVIMLFLIGVWALLVIFIAVIDDIRKQPDVVNGVSYMIALFGGWMSLYLFFSVSVQYYIGYPLLMIYWAFALHRHLRHNTAPYVCGACGAPLHTLGECPNCGSINE